ncbi:MAG: ATP-binding cassette domain-containing protein [Treponema sp.]|nr:ATP-binding cassette domain-containing protein [Treponema sp.]
MNVKLSGIELNYSYKQVLRGVNVEFLEGKIHALLGENGAGKSSLMKILTGFITPVSSRGSDLSAVLKGKILLDDKEVVFKKPAHSLKNGISCVYQHPYLSDSLSVKENLRVGIKSGKKTEDQFKDQLDELVLPLLENISFETKAGCLSGDQRFFVAFYASLLRNPKVLILDEPTALLSEKQSEKLFFVLRNFAKKGMNIIVITHKPEDLNFCDDVTRLVEGVVAESVVSESMDNNQLKNYSEQFTVDHGERISETEGLTNLTAKKCYELRKKYSGRAAIIPTDRTYLASNPNLTITQLVCSTFSESKNPKLRKAHTEEIIKKAEINIRPEEKVFNLSGGMLQRLILERELFLNPETIYLEDPFQGLDYASCERLSERLSLCEKQGTKVVYLKK